MICKMCKNLNQYKIAIYRFIVIHLQCVIYLKLYRCAHGQMCTGKISVQNAGILLENLENVNVGIG